MIMKKLKYVKLFENFGSDLDTKLRKALCDICFNYKEECLGSAVHISEDFGDGSILLRYAEMTDDIRIKKILNNVAELCKEECEGSAEHITEYISDDDCDYIASFLGLKPLNYEDDWTDEEETTWFG